jgi:hypothetical protein
MQVATSQQSESPRLGREFVVSLVFSTAIQLVLLFLASLVERQLPVSVRLVTGLLPIPVSAACGAILLRKRLWNRTVAIPIGFFFVALVVVAVATAVVNAITGSYDVP